MDGAILEVSTFVQRHPGGARLILNAIGTDITDELVGEEMSLGATSGMAFSPHAHTEVRETALTLPSLEWQSS